MATRLSVFALFSGRANWKRSKFGRILCANTRETLSRIGVNVKQVEREFDYKYTVTNHRNRADIAYLVIARCGIRARVHLSGSVRISRQSPRRLTLERLIETCTHTRICHSLEDSRFGQVRHIFRSLFRSRSPGDGALCS